MVAWLVPHGGLGGELSQTVGEVGDLLFALLYVPAGVLEFAGVVHGADDDGKEERENDDVGGECHCGCVLWVGIFRREGRRWRGV